MTDIQKALAYAATHACMGKPPKKEDCPCAPCNARRAVFGGNVPVQIQEPMRIEVEKLRSALEAARETLRDIENCSCSNSSPCDCQPSLSAREALAKVDEILGEGPKA